MKPSYGSQVSGLFSSPAKRAFVLGLLLMTVTLALYAPVTHNAFVSFDDDTYIITNAHVRAGLNWSTVKWSFTRFEQANWHPLTWLSHALDCELFGLNAAGHHFAGAWLHAMNVAILFWLLQSATGFTWRSLVVAALFGVHPVNVESVAWAAERKNVLSMLFFLFALMAYGWYARQPQLRRYGVVFLLFLLALMSKPQVITFPFLLLLWDYWPLRRMAAQPTPGAAPENMEAPRFSVLWLVLEKVPLFLLSAASAVVTMMAQRSGHALRTSSDFSLFNRIETALSSYVRYVGMAIWPSKLAVFYPHPTKLFPTWQVVAVVLVLLFAMAIVVWQWRQRPYLVVGWLWFLGSMFPMIGIVQVGGQAMADRYAYIPFIGLFVMAVWGAADWVGERKISATWAAVPATVVLIALGAVTHRQIGFWRDSPAMWLRAIEATENNFVAHDNLAIYLARRGRVEEAVVHLRAALAIRPDDPLATLNLGTYELERGNLQAAIERYKILTLPGVDPDLRTTAYSNLGSAYRRLGDYANAKRSYEAALKLSPGRPSQAPVFALVGLGLVAEHEGDFAEAVRQFSKAMAVAPTDVGYLLLARTLEESGRATEAQAARQQAGLLSRNLDAAQKEADALMQGQ